MYGRNSDAYSCFCKIKSNGTLIMNNLLGKTGQVYLTIPEKGSGFGKLISLLMKDFRAWCSD